MGEGSGECSEGAMRTEGRVILGYQFPLHQRKINYTDFSCLFPTTGRFISVVWGALVCWLQLEDTFLPQMFSSKRQKWHHKSSFTKTRKMLFFFFSFFTLNHGVVWDYLCMTHFSTDVVLLGVTPIEGARSSLQLSLTVESRLLTCWPSIPCRRGI